MVTPYYDDGTCVIYHGDCRDILPTLGVTPALVLADPPYGVNERTDRASKGRGGGGKNWPSRDLPPVHGDDEPFDPALILAFPRVVVFGANYFAERLPPSPCGSSGTNWMA